MRMRVVIRDVPFATTISQSQTTNVVMEKHPMTQSVRYNVTSTLIFVDILWTHERMILILLLDAQQHCRHSVHLTFSLDTRTNDTDTSIGCSTALQTFSTPDFFFGHTNE